ncbi:MAG: RNA polymerase sigma factor [Planctomycetota bacterium]
MPTEAADPPPDQHPATDAHVAAAATQVRRYLRFLGCSRDALDDLVQETMLAAVRHFEGAAAPQAWLWTTARNGLRQLLRRQGRQREVPALDRLDERWREQIADDGGERQKEALRRCLDALPRHARAAMALRYGDGLSRGEVGRRLGLGDEGAKSLLARVRRSLADCIERRLR